MTLITGGVPYERFESHASAVGAYRALPPW